MKPRFRVVDIVTPLKDRDFCCLAKLQIYAGDIRSVALHRVPLASGEIGQPCVLAIESEIAFARSCFASTARFQCFSA